MPLICFAAGTLLDLYGEDIRARAYVTPDPIKGEMMLRQTLRCLSCNSIWNRRPIQRSIRRRFRQEVDPNRATEFVQVGFEVFDGTDVAQADASVFAKL